jgi:cytochrome bd ubiquinol oxidase subunit II
MALVYGGRYEPARYCGAAAVAAIVAGFALSRWPTILPGLTIRQAAAGHDALVWIVAAVVGGGVILFPALGFLFRLTLTGTFSAADQGMPAGPGALGLPNVRARLLTRVAIACLIVGFLLLNIADADWEHAVGLLLLLTFIVLGFRVIIFPALAATGTEETRAVE